MQEALRLQADLASRVLLDDDLPTNVSTMAGVDVAYGDETAIAYAAVAVLRVDNWEIIESATASARTSFPYIPGLFSFRELPSISIALEKLSIRPDLVICDGHGIAHPRRFGLACHLGVTFDIPSIGCAKTLLFGDVGQPGQNRGDMAEITAGGETIGAALRTRVGVKPVYVSSGHKITLRTSLKEALRACPQYRLPEPLRVADRIVNSMKRAATTTI